MRAGGGAGGDGLGIVKGGGGVAKGGGGVAKDLPGGGGAGYKLELGVASDPDRVRAPFLIERKERMR